MSPVQLRFPWDAPPARRGPRHVIVDGAAVEVDVVRHRRARRYVVRVGADGGVRLTVPRGASIDAGLRFAATQAPWIARERLRQLERLAPWDDGTRVWHRGESVALRRDGARVICGDVRLELAPDADLRAAVERHWRDRAAAELPPRCHELAARCALRVARVSVRDQRSRWGACSPRGVITLNWRLVQMPASVSDYVLFHELMHLRQPNHSRRFWREVDAVCPWWREAERWLRRHGRDIL
jgi:predicted metal-dependent hydrolase